MKSARSITERTYRQLKADLLSCRLRPGTRLRTNELSERLHISLSGVREALSRLTSDGLVEADPQRGFRASPLSSADLLKLVEASIAIEKVCIRESILKGDEAWQARLCEARDAVIDSSVDAAAGNSRLNILFMANHHHFHEVLISACDNNWMLKMRDTCALQAERYRQIYAAEAPALDTIRASYAEITAAALRHDAEAAIAEMAHQFWRNAQRFIAVLDREEDLVFWFERKGRATSR